MKPFDLKSKTIWQQNGNKYMEGEERWRFYTVYSQDSIQGIKLKNYKLTFLWLPLCPCLFLDVVLDLCKATCFPCPTSQHSPTIPHEDLTEVEYLIFQPFWVLLTLFFLRVTASGSLKMADKAQKDMVVSAVKSQPFNFSLCHLIIKRGFSFQNLSVGLVSFLTFSQTRGFKIYFLRIVLNRAKISLF